jgi:hypothetical protein
LRKLIVAHTEGNARRLFFQKFPAYGRSRFFMKVSRAFVLVVATLPLAACQTAQNMLQMPVNLAKSLLSPVGRTMGISSENTRSSGELRIEDRELREAVAVTHEGGPSAAPEAPVTALAQR